MLLHNPSVRHVTVGVGTRLAVAMNVIPPIDET